MPIAFFRYLYDEYFCTVKKKTNLQKCTTPDMYFAVYMILYEKKYG